MPACFDALPHLSGAATLRTELWRRGPSWLAVLVISAAGGSGIAQQIELGSEDIFLSDQPTAVPGEASTAAVGPAPHPGVHAGAADVANGPAFATLLRVAEAALARGETSEAAVSFEEAAILNDETPEAEMGMVRAYLQAGEYRRALSFATLVAGEHRGAWEAEALLAWIEYLGGQKAYAQKRLDTALKSAPEHPALREVRARFRALSGGGALPVISPNRMLAPYGEAPAVSASRQPQGVASGVVVDGGARVLSSASALIGTEGAYWVRNGLGQLSPAVLEKRDDASGVAVLKLTKPFAAAGATAATAATARAFPGSPCYVVEFPALALGQPAWPVLSAGFLGRAMALSDNVEAVVDLPPGPRGGAVLDIGGRLVGLMLPVAGAPTQAGKAERILLRSAWRDLLPEAKAMPVAGDSQPVRQPIPLIYEQMLPAVVTILAKR